MDDIVKGVEGKNWSLLVNRSSRRRVTGILDGREGKSQGIVCVLAQLLCKGFVCN